MKILFCTKLLPEGFSDLQGRFELVVPKVDKFSRNELLEHIKQCDVLVPTFLDRVDSELISAGCGRLKLIANYGVGYNNIDVEFATLHNIVVTNTPQPVIEPTAELAFALMMGVARKISVLDRSLRQDVGLQWGVLENLGLSLYAKTLGIVGMGRIGQAVARRAVASGMRVVYTNRNRLSSEIEQRYNATHLSLEELLKQSDVVSLHAPLTPETHHLINKDKIDLMKSSAILINTARGAIVDEIALVDALKKGKIFAAGLDVFENEPNIHPELLKLDNVVLLPHIGTGTTDARNDMGRLVSQNIIRFFDGNTEITRVN